MSIFVKLFPFQWLPQIQRKKRLAVIEAIFTTMPKLRLTIPGTIISIIFTQESKLTRKIFDGNPFGNSTKLATLSGAIPAQFTQNKNNLFYCFCEKQT